MKKLVLSSQFSYFARGTRAQLILHAGTHGDESGSIAAVTSWVTTHEALLPDFIFVPEVSPSAVRLGTRKNERNNDMNRNFRDDNTDPEAVWNRTVLQPVRAEIMITFHEDTEYDSFYMYDVGKTPMPTATREKIQHEITKLGVPLLNGVDDTSDPELGFEFTEGYRFFEFGENDQKTENDMITGWCLRKGIVKRTLIVEIPGQAKPNTKEKLVDIVMRNFAIRSSVTFSEVAQ